MAARRKAVTPPPPEDTLGLVGKRVFEKISGKIGTVESIWWGTDGRAHYTVMFDHYKAQYPKHGGIAYDMSWARGLKVVADRPADDINLKDVEWENAEERVATRRLLREAVAA